MKFLAWLLVLLAAPATTPNPDDATWRELEPGLELRWLTSSRPSAVGDSRILVVRADPDAWDLVLIARSQTGDDANQTARGWAEAHGLTFATNAGMFATDYSTHVGYMESDGHVNSKTVNHYESVAAFDPKDPAKSPSFRIFDLDSDVEGDSVSVDSIRRDYRSLVQNLRLIKRPGENRWGQQEKQWSEAALGEDAGGRILFVFCRSPFTMHDLNRELLRQDIGLVALQHLEGGPEAQVFLDAGDVELELFGSFETAFNEDDGNSIPWPIPNVIGVRPRETSARSYGALHPNRPAYRTDDR